MKIQEAYSILELTNHVSYDQKVIKRKYHSLCLKYHPDKNNNDEECKNKFQSINEAYQLLANNKPNVIYSYDNHLISVLDSLLPFYLRNEKIYSIIRDIINTCEKLAILNISKLDVETIEQIYKLLYINKDLLNIPETTCNNIKNIIQEKRKNDECIILHPTLNDLFCNNLYRLKHKNETYNIPLWHKFLVYEHENSELYVKCIPNTPENVFIDNKNNIYITIKVNINDIWGKEYFDYWIDDKKISIECQKLKFKESQTIVLVNQGISKAGLHDIYDITRKSNIYINLDITKDI